MKQINYVTYKRNKKSRKSNWSRSDSNSSEQNSSSNAFDVGFNTTEKHQEECRTKTARCDGCHKIGYFKKCCKKLGNFPNNSNQQNQSPSTVTGRMNIVQTFPQLDADFFNERGLPKTYSLPPVQQEQQHTRGMNILKKFNLKVMLFTFQKMV